MKKNTHNIGVLLGTVIIFVGLTQSTSAQLQTYRFTGAVTVISGTPFGIPATAGDPVEIEFAYDVADSGNVLAPGYVVYSQPLPSRLSVSISGITVQSTSGQFSVFHDLDGTDGLAPDTFAASGNLESQTGSIQFTFEDDTKSIFAVSLSLPDPFDCASFQAGRGTIQDWAVAPLKFIDFEIDCVALVATPVEIDIHPGQYPNPVNLHSRGVIPVAIFSTADFNAATIDPETLKLGESGAAGSFNLSHIEDVNGDGLLDVVVLFQRESTGIHTGDTSAALFGQTLGGQPITGSDSIKVVGR